MFERYTEHARRSIFFARYEASTVGSPYIESEHFLLGLLREDHFLRTLVKAEAVRKVVEAHTTPNPRLAASVDLPLSHEMKRILSYAAEESERLGSREINSLHLALGILREEKSLAARILREQGFSRDSVLARLAQTTSAPAHPPRVIGPLAKRLAAEAAVARVKLAAIDEEAADAAITGGQGWTRIQALGHLIDLATAHHRVFARALVEPRVEAEGLPEPPLAMAQNYDGLPWRQLRELWSHLNHLLVHILTTIPPERWETPCRIGADASDIPLNQLVDEYVDRVEAAASAIIADS